MYFLVKDPGSPGVRADSELRFSRKRCTCPTGKETSVSENDSSSQW